MSSAGHVSTMINRLKENRSLLNSRSVRDKSKHAFLNYGKIHKESKKLHHEKADPKLLLRLRKILKRDKVKQQMKLKYMVFIMVILSLIIIYSIFAFMGLF